MRLSLTLTASSMFVSGLLVMLIFLAEQMQVEAGAVILGAFSVSVLLMLGGLAAFVADLWVSLAALQAEVRRALGPEVDELGLL